MSVPPKITEKQIHILGTCTFEISRRQKSAVKSSVEVLNYINVNASSQCLGRIQEVPRSYYQIPRLR